MSRLIAAGPWMADYGRIYKNDDGDEAVCCGFSRGLGEEAVCCGFSRGLGKTTTRLKRLDTGETIECDFTFCTRPWEIECDWYAVDKLLTRDEQLALHAKF